MPLTVLSDSDIHSLLISLSRNEIVRLQEKLAEALHEYSTGAQETSPCASSNQPKRMSIPAPNHQTTLFMPASTSTSRGMKIITLANGITPSPTGSTSTLASDSSHSIPLSFSTSRSSDAHPSSHTPSSSSETPTSSRTPSSSHPPSLASLKLTDSAASSQSITPHGSLTLFTPSGSPYAFLAAEELTAFRTALAATLILNRRQHVHSVTVFGAGRQAAWHVRLALILRGQDIHHIDIINRSSTRALELLHEIYAAPDWAALRAVCNEKLRFSVLSANHGEYARMLKEHVRGADVIFLCTPSPTPLFPAEFLTSSEGRRKGRYISAVGSYRPHMVELHPDVLRQAAAPPEGKHHHHHHHKHAARGGVVVVDSLEACLRDSGEVRQAGLGAEQLVEVGELLMVKKASMREIEMGGEGEVGLKRWLEAGNVIYKSVGLGVMDICVGEGLAGLAAEKRVGVRVDF